jgi:hypothetical protein
MKKFLISGLLALGALALLAAAVFPAAFTVNLVGKWEGKISGIRYIPGGTPDMQYYNEAITIRILNQDGDRFYGETSTGGRPYSRFTGVISEGKGWGTGKGVVSASIMPVYEAGAWRMTCHTQYPDPEGFIDTGKFAVHRTSLTP